MLLVETQCPGTVDNRELSERRVAQRDIEAEELALTTTNKFFDTVTESGRVEVLSWEVLAALAGWSKSVPNMIPERNLDKQGKTSPPLTPTT